MHCKENNIFSYQQFNNDVLHELSFLSEKGFHQNAVVLLLTDNSLTSILLYLFCLKSHVPVIMVNAQECFSVLKEYILQWEPDWLFYPSDICLIDIGKYIHIREWRGYQLFRSVNDRGDYVRSKRKWRKDLAVLLSTSGSTGSKKFVMLSRTNLRANAESIIQSLEIKPGDRAAVILPISYSYGLSVINSYLLAGGKLLIPGSRLFEKSFWDFLEAEQVQAICGVPYSYEMYRKLKIFQRELSCLKLMTQAGGALGEGMTRYLLQEAQRRKIDFAVMYGQTEATARISSFFLNRHPERLGSVGRVVPGGRITIHNSDVEGWGEIVYEGENVFLGYATSVKDMLQDEGYNEKAEKYQKRQLMTGDMGFLDSEGYLYITGRKKRFVKIYGKRICLDKLQKDLSRWLQKEIACIGFSREGKENVCIFTTDKQELQRVQMVAERHFFFLQGRAEYRNILEIPHTVNGKTDYNALRLLIENE